MHIACGHKPGHLRRRQNIKMSSHVVIKPVAKEEERNCSGWQRPNGLQYGHYGIIGKRL